MTTEVKKDVTDTGLNFISQQTVDNFCDEAFNMGVDRCIEVVKDMAGGAEVSTLMEIADKLTQLKKPS